MALKTTRRGLMAGAAAIAIAHPARAWLHPGAAAGPPAQSAGVAPIGGGAYVTGGSMAPDGTLAVRIDTFGLYLADTASYTGWTNLFNATSLPASLWNFSLGTAGGTLPLVNAGCYSVAVAPSNSSIIYAMFDPGSVGASTSNLMLVSIDKGAHWAVMGGFPAIDWDADAEQASGPARVFQRKMAVDPNNSSVVYVGTPINGLYVTANGTAGLSGPTSGTSSATFSSVAGVPANIDGLRCGINAIAFDTSLGTTGGKTSRILCCSQGNGIYETQNAGSSWSLAGSGGPKFSSDGIVSGGNYYTANGWNVVPSYPGYPNSSDVAIYTNAGGAGAGTWHNGGGAAPTALTINPFDTTWIAGWGNTSGNYDQGVISGSPPTIAWQGPYFNSYADATVPPSDEGWINRTRPSGAPNNWSGGGIWFDPVLNELPQGRIWWSWGFGVSRIDISSKTLSSATNLAFTSTITGLQGLIPQFIVTQAGYPPVAAVQDNQLFKLSTTTPAGTTPVVGAISGAQAAGWSIDASQSVSGLLAIALSSNYVGKGFHWASSTDGGSNWTEFSAQPFSSDGGDVTCAGLNQFAALATYGTAAPIYWTGSAWASSTGAPSATYGSGYNNRIKVLANDAAGSMYLQIPSSGLYKSVNGGATWSSVDNVSIVSSVFQTALKAVPGNARFLFFTKGLPGGTYPTGQSFYKRTADGNGGWAAVANVNDVFAFGFGQVYPTYTYPTLWLMGFVNKGGAGYKWGLWRSRDLGVSDWTWITDWPAGCISAIYTMSGDMNDYTTVYLGPTAGNFTYVTGIP